MKKLLVVVMTFIMTMALSVTVFAANKKLTLDQAKKAALNYAGVKASEATFTKAHKDWEDGREVYEIEFYSGNTEYDMDVDVNNGRITDYNVEYHGNYGQNAYYYGHYDYDDDVDDDDMFDWDD